MDEISDNTFVDVQTSETQDDSPSLLTLILELTPGGWYNIRDEISLMDVVKSLLVFLNAHLSLNNSNQVAFILTTPKGSRFLHPTPAKSTATDSTEEAPTENEPQYISKGMYRQFRTVDEAVIEQLNKAINAMLESDVTDTSSSLSGALSLALTYTNRMMKLDQSVSTTTASAITAAANITNKDSSAAAATSGSGYGSTLIKSRIVVVTPNDNESIKYISLMKTMFGAQKMKVPMDIVKLGREDSPYLQQAADATNGVYLHIKKPLGLIQVLCTAFFIEPSIRPLVILPTNSNVNYRASCFVTGKSVEIGFVCSVCLCIMSFVPDDSKCPTCGSVFDSKLIEKMKRKPQVKKRKLASGSPAPDTPVPETPAPETPSATTS